MTIALPVVKTKGKHHASVGITPTYNTAKNRRVLRKGKLPLLKARRVLDELSSRFASDYALVKLETNGTTVFAVIARGYDETVFRQDGKGNTFPSIEYREERIPLLV